MQFSLRCPHCGVKIKVRAEWAGRRANCPNPDCQQKILIPQTLPQAEQPVSAPQPVAVPRSRETAAVAKPEQKISPERVVTAPTPTRANRELLTDGPSKVATTVPVEKVKTKLVEQPAKKSKSKKSKRGKKKRGIDRWLFVGTGILLLAVIGGVGVQFFHFGKGSVAVAAGDPPQEQIEFEGKIQPLLKKYCMDCHNLTGQDGGLNLEQYHTLADIDASRKTWEKVFGRVKIGAMPPTEASQPTEDERKQIVAWLDHKLFFVDCDLSPDPGRVTIHRLNRNEYNNTVRDLMGVDFKPAANFPSDDVGYGFDNIGDVLSVPPLLVEKYLDAAEQITARAIITNNPASRAQHLGYRQLKNGQSAHDADGFNAKIITSSGSVSGEFEVPESAEYLLRVITEQDEAGTEPSRFELKVDEKSFGEHEVPGHHEPVTREVKLHLDAGKKQVFVNFLNDFFDKDAPKGRKDRNLYVKSIDLEGPLGLPPNLPESHRKLVQYTPHSELTVENAALSNLRMLVYRAYRRPVNDAEVMKYVKFVRSTVERGESFESGMQVALQALLVSPEFLFRIEKDASEKEGSGEAGARDDSAQKTASAITATRRLEDFEMASRLSYFMWGSMPDDQLLDLARKQQLQDDKVLAEQVRRMMNDPKSNALIENFAGQWLGLRKLKTNDVAPDPERFPDFTSELRDDLWKETEQFFASVVREDRSLMDLVDGRYTFLNERLAKHYGIPNVSGPEFRKVELTDGHRAGLVTQGSILTLTSYPTRTSPVKRGEWVLENILGEAPPPPPPVVPGLDETQKSNPNLSLRKQLEIHRADPGCASCHKVMDEIGFSLEKFDPVGRYREKDGAFEIDAMGVLPSGEKFSGPGELVQVLRKRESQFTRCLAEKLLTFALGRGLEYYDKCAIDRIVSETTADKYRFSALVRSIALSPPFRQRRTGGN